MTLLPLLIGSAIGAVAGFLIAAKLLKEKHEAEVFGLNQQIRGQQFLDMGKDRVLNECRQFVNKLQGFYAVLPGEHTLTGYGSQTELEVAQNPNLLPICGTTIMYPRTESSFCIVPGERRRKGGE